MAARVPAETVDRLRLTGDRICLHEEPEQGTALEMTLRYSGFDEEAYLTANPDVRDAVAVGAFASGFAHFRRYGRYEARAGVPHGAAPPDYRPLAAMPSPALRERVHGAADAETFDRYGRWLCDDILDAAAGRVDLTPMSRVLDFGCGSGRVMRHLIPQCPAVVAGVDIDREAIAWCQTNLPEATFHQTGEWPPLPFGSAYFDLIFSISVFTHLPEDMQLAWVEELSRVTKPNGILLLSIHSPALMPSFDAEGAQRIAKHGFYYRRGSTTNGLPDFYRTAYHSEDYVKSTWGQWLVIDAFVSNGVNDFQDLVVARPR